MATTSEVPLMLLIVESIAWFSTGIFITTLIREVRRAG